jgi:hypothetical protein
MGRESDKTIRRHAVDTGASLKPPTAGRRAHGAPRLDLAGAGRFAAATVPASVAREHLQLT